MSLYEKITADMNAALKAHDPLKVSVLRMAIAAIRNLEMQKSLKAASDADCLAILEKQIKQRQDSIDQYTKGGRQDLADKEASEKVILEAYMPKALSSEEVAAIIDAAILSTGASAPRDMGKVMKVVTEQTRARADGKVVSSLVAARLGKGS